MFILWILLGLDILIMAFLVRMFKYTRDEVYAATFVWSLGLMLLAILTRMFRDRPPFSEVPWYALGTCYIVVALVTIVPYAIFRRRWPYPFLKDEEILKHALEFHEHGDHRRALPAIRQLVARSPRRPDARYWQGRILNHLGRFREAIRQLEFAQELAPDSLAVLLELGCAFGMLGKYQEAVKIFEQALKLDPENTYATEQLAICREKIRDTSASQ